MGTNADVFEMDPMEDGGEPDGGYLEVPADDDAATGEGDARSFAERMADELGDDPSADWFRNQGWQSPQDVERSFRETKGELTRLQQEYARTLDAFRDSEEVPQQDDMGVDAGEIAQIAQLIDSGQVDAGQAIAHLFQNVMPKMLDARVGSLVQQSVTPVQSGLEQMQLRDALSEMEGMYGKQKAKELAREVMPLLDQNPYNSTPEGMKQLFHAAYGRTALANERRQRKARDMDTVDQSSRTRQQTKDTAAALQNWLLNP